jgi:hypothetical protein
MKVMDNDIGRFYRCITVRFSTRKEIYSLRSAVSEQGNSEEIFIKKVLL